MRWRLSKSKYKLRNNRLAFVEDTVGVIFANELCERHSRWCDYLGSKLFFQACNLFAQPIIKLQECVQYWFVDALVLDGNVKHITNSQMRQVLHDGLQDANVAGLPCVSNKPGCSIRAVCRTST